ncbi:hypothetical protein PILCRDRAFT_67324 [Piloderma croceum F 1598]|uniref:CipC-like antibiotic response protein n=1 Tax=Piloderma croceum (strain F 1598) TaxID=765440 RepID=A0A0C3G2K0_PILCF|nr:hypothetical protein PILCRDRAFT_67324 [Piloderma croceum F 1598]
MGWFHSESDEAQAHAELTNAPHKASVTHELLASGIAFEAAREYEKHVEKNGKPANHKAAVEILAALTGGLVDRIVETKGLDHIDKEKAKHQAKKRAEEKLAEAGEY